MLSTGPAGRTTAAAGFTGSAGGTAGTTGGTVAGGTAGLAESEGSFTLGTKDLWGAVGDAVGEGVLDELDADAEPVGS